MMTNEKRKASSPTILALSSIPGLIAVYGIGHLYMRKVRRGLIFLSIGIVLWGAMMMNGALPFQGAAILPALWFVTWVWQTHDAYTLTGKTSPYKSLRKEAT